MSIIYEAIQKVEKENNQQKSMKDKGKLPKLLIFILALAIVGALAIYLSQNVFSLIKEKAKGVTKDYKNAVTLAQNLQEGSKKEENKRSKTSSSQYILEGILFDKEMPLAVINGKILKKGDVLDNVEIIDISPTIVKIFDKEKNQELELKL